MSRMLFATSSHRRRRVSKFNFSFFVLLVIWSVVNLFVPFPPVTNFGVVVLFALTLALDGDK